MIIIIPKVILAKSTYKILNIMNLVKKIFYSSKHKDLLITAKQKILKGNFTTAIRNYDEILRVDKQNYEALYNRGKLYFETKNYFYAQRDLEKLHDLNSDYETDLNYCLSKIYSKNNQLEKALTFGEKFIENIPDQLEAMYHVAKLRFQLKNYDGALLLANKLCATNPDEYNCRYLRSLINFSKNKYQDSLVDVDKALEITSIHSYIFNLRGLINTNLRKYDEALEDFDYAIRLEPDNTIYSFNKAKLFERMNNYNEAMVILDKLQIEQPKNTKINLFKAEILIKQKKYNDALNLYKEYPQSEVPNKAIQYKIAALNLLTTKNVEATEFLESELSSENSNLIDKQNSLLLLTKLKIEKRNYLDALNHIDELLEFDSNSEDLKITKALLNIVIGKYEDALEILKNLSSPKANYLKGYAYFRFGELYNALDVLDQIPPSSVNENILILQSYIYIRLDKRELALKKLKDIEVKDLKIGFIENVLNFEFGNLDEIEEISHSHFEGELREHAKILNALLNFEKGLYNSAKFQLNNIQPADDNTNEKLQPVLEFAKKEV